MIRALLVFVALALLAGAGAWFANHPGRLVIDWQGHRLESSFAVMGLLTLAFAMAVTALYQLWRWLRRSPMRFGSWSASNRRRRGYQALTQGLVAAAAGDAKAARLQAKRAEALLEDPSLTLLLAAQAAQLDGDEAAAERHFQSMLEQPETEFLGLRGLIVQARRRGDRDTALALARRAFALKPDTQWLNDALFELEIASGDWRAARATLAQAIKRGTIDKQAGRRHEAALLVSEAGKLPPPEAVKLAEQAVKLAPDSIPAAALATRLLAQQGNAKRARRVAQNAWSVTPHPEIAAAYAAIDAEAPPQARLDAMRQLVAAEPQHRESRLALAGVAIGAGNFAAAREALGEAATAGDADARVHRLLARLEEAERGDPAAARTALLKAVDSPAEPRWTCGQCQRTAPEWTPQCPHCGAFDRLEWRG